MPIKLNVEAVCCSLFTISPLHLFAERENCREREGEWELPVDLYLLVFNFGLKKILYISFLIFLLNFSLPFYSLSLPQFSLSNPFSYSFVLWTISD